MSLISVVQDVCAVVGVARPSSIFAGLNSSRTQQELLALANEMAQRIAYETRDWGILKQGVAFDAGQADNSGLNQSVFGLPADFQRLLKTSNLYKQSTPTLPLRYVPDFDTWFQRRLAGFYDARGEWRIVGKRQLSVAPPVFDLNTLLPWANSFQYAVGAKVKDTSSTTFWAAKVAHTSAAAGTFAADRAANPTYWAQIFQEKLGFVYLKKNCIALASSPPPANAGDVFTSDSDTFLLDERLLKLGMIWQWKANKGSPYAEDMGTYSDALAAASGADGPAPIIVGRMPISAAVNVAYPWPPGWGPQP